MGLVVRLIVNAATLSLAAALIPGIELRGVGVAAIAAIAFGLVNAVMRPVLVVLAFPLTVLTLGLFMVVLNAFGLWLTWTLMPGFDIRGFVPALLAALLISAVSWLLSVFVR